MFLTSVAPQHHYGAFHAPPMPFMYVPIRITGNREYDSLLYLTMFSGEAFVFAAFLVGSWIALDLFSKKLAEFEYRISDRVHQTLYEDLSLAKKVLFSARLQREAADSQERLQFALASIDTAQAMKLLTGRYEEILRGKKFDPQFLRGPYTFMARDLSRAGLSVQTSFPFSDMDKVLLLSRESERALSLTREVLSKTSMEDLKSGLRKLRTEAERRKVEIRKLFEIILSDSEEIDWLTESEAESVLIYAEKLKEFAPHFLDFFVESLDSEAVERAFESGRLTETELLRAFRVKIGQEEADAEKVAEVLLATRARGLESALNRSLAATGYFAFSVRTENIETAKIVLVSEDEILSVIEEKAVSGSLDDKADFLTKKWLDRAVRVDAFRRSVLSVGLKNADDAEKAVQRALSEIDETAIQEIRDELHSKIRSLLQEKEDISEVEKELEKIMLEEIKSAIDYDEISRTEVSRRSFMTAFLICFSKAREEPEWPLLKRMRLDREDLSEFVWKLIDRGDRIASLSNSRSEEVLSPVEVNLYHFKREREYSRFLKERVLSVVRDRASEAEKTVIERNAQFDFLDREGQKRLFRLLERIYREDCLSLIREGRDFCETVKMSPDAARLITSEREKIAAFVITEAAREAKVSLSPELISSRILRSEKAKEASIEAIEKILGLSKKEAELYFKKKSAEAFEKYSDQELRIRALAVNSLFDDETITREKIKSWYEVRYLARKLNLTRKGDALEEKNLYIGREERKKLLRLAKERPEAAEELLMKYDLGTLPYRTKILDETILEMSSRIRERLSAEVRKEIGDFDLTERGVLDLTHADQEKIFDFLRETAQRAAERRRRSESASAEVEKSFRQALSVLETAYLDLEEHSAFLTKRESQLMSFKKLFSESSLFREAAPKFFYILGQLEEEKAQLFSEAEKKGPRAMEKALRKAQSLEDKYKSMKIRVGEREVRASDLWELKNLLLSRAAFHDMDLHAAASNEIRNLLYSAKAEMTFSEAQSRLSHGRLSEQILRVIDRKALSETAFGARKLSYDISQKGSNLYHDFVISKLRNKLEKKIVKPTFKKAGLKKVHWKIVPDHVEREVLQTVRQSEKSLPLIRQRASVKETARTALERMVFQTARTEREEHLSEEEILQLQRVKEAEKFAAARSI